MQQNVCTVTCIHKRMCFWGEIHSEAPVRNADFDYCSEASTADGNNLEEYNGIDLWAELFVILIVWLFLSKLLPVFPVRKIIRETGCISARCCLTSPANI